MESAPLREFILAHTCILPDDLDPQLLQVATAGTSITSDAFLFLLRENAVADTSSITHFLGISVDGETAKAEDCRNGLFVYAQRYLKADYTEEKWDRIFNTVMWDADVTVPMEKWIAYCNMIGRIIRLAHYA